MKVRWSLDSIRLRITPSELEAIRRGESVQETVAFPGGVAWSVTLCSCEHETMLASDAQEVYLSLSDADRARLACADTEGVYFQRGVPPLRYYVEKDFPCAHPRAAEAQEPTTETFSAPKGFEQRKKETAADAN